MNLVIIPLFILIFSTGLALKFTFQTKPILFNTCGLTLKIFFHNAFKIFPTNFAPLLRILYCEWFEFASHLPVDVLLLTKVSQFLKNTQVPDKVRGLFYNFTELQKTSAGRQFLIENAIFCFTIKEWMPDKFSISQVQQILKEIYMSQRTKIASPKLFTQLMTATQFEYFLNESTVELIDSSLIAEFKPTKHEKLSWPHRWFLQASPYLATSDLIYYRMAFLYWTLQDCDLIKLASNLKDALDEHASPENPFRQSVQALFISSGKPVKKYYDDCKRHFVAKDVETQSTFLFEHLTAAILLGIEVKVKVIGELLTKFTPSQVSPHICRAFLDYLDEEEFSQLYKSMPSLWLRHYQSITRENSHFPLKHLPTNIQLRIWQRKILYLKHGTKHSGLITITFRLPINDFHTWDIIQDSRKLMKSPDFVGQGENGFIKVDCRFHKDDHPKLASFIKGRIADLALNGQSLPKFLPLSKKKMELKNTFEIPLDLVDQLCIKNVQPPPTNNDAIKTLDLILRHYRKGRVPSSLYCY